MSKKQSTTVKFEKMVLQIFREKIFLRTRELNIPLCEEIDQIESRTERLAMMQQLNRLRNIVGPMSEHRKGGKGYLTSSIGHLGQDSNEAYRSGKKAVYTITPKGLAYLETLEAA